MHFTRSYIKKHIMQFTFLTFLYAGVFIILFYDCVYSKNPMDVIVDSFNYEKIIREHDIPIKPD